MSDINGQVKTFHSSVMEWSNRNMSSAWRVHYCICMQQFICNFLLAIVVIYTRTSSSDYCNSRDAIMRNIWHAATNWLCTVKKKKKKKGSQRSMPTTPTTFVIVHSNRFRPQYIIALSQTDIWRPVTHYW